MAHEAVSHATENSMNRQTTIARIRFLLPVMNFEQLQELLEHAERLVPNYPADAAALRAYQDKRRADGLAAGYARLGARKRRPRS